jgi:hypothetical protein
MAKKTRSRKRPCRVCGKWFMPNPRLGDRQMTCGADTCKQQWHAAKCAAWNKENRAYFKEIYLRKCLEPVTHQDYEPSASSSPSSRGNSPVQSPSLLHLPREPVQEVMGAQQLVIIEYIVRVLLRGVQEVISAQRLKFVDEYSGLVAVPRSRGDSQPPQQGVSSSC